MAQFPDVEHAVSAVQEILNTPAGPHIRKSHCRNSLGGTKFCERPAQNA